MEKAVTKYKKSNHTTTHLLDDLGLLLLLLRGDESRCFFVAYPLRSWLESLRLGNVSSGKVNSSVTLLCINMQSPALVLCVYQK